MQYFPFIIPELLAWHRHWPTLVMLETGSVPIPTPSSTSDPIHDLCLSTSAFRFAFFFLYFVLNLFAQFVSDSFSLQGFDQPTFKSRMLAMAKPTFLAIKNSAKDQPSIVFVPSRRQTRLTASEILTFCASEENPKRFLLCSDDDIAPYLNAVKESVAFFSLFSCTFLALLNCLSCMQTLRQTLEYGIGYYHDGMAESDIQIVQKLFAAGGIQVLVCNFESCWGMPLSAHLVVVAGTQFYDGREHRYVDYQVTDVLQMMGRACRPLEDEVGKCAIFCHAPRKEYYKRFLFEPLPVEVLLFWLVFVLVCL